jgi:hypothetical protein
MNFILARKKVISAANGINVTNFFKTQTVESQKNSPPLENQHHTPLQEPPPRSLNWNHKRKKDENEDSKGSK